MVGTIRRAGVGANAALFVAWHLRTFTLVSSFRLGRLWRL